MNQLKLNGIKRMDDINMQSVGGMDYGERKCPRKCWKIPSLSTIETVLPISEFPIGTKIILTSRDD